MINRKKAENAWRTILFPKKRKVLVESINEVFSRKKFFQNWARRRLGFAKKA
jgi:hypothetical protein